MPNQDTASEPDRRKYFRVACDATIEIKPRTDDPADSGKINDLFTLSKWFNLRAAMSSLDLEANHLIRQISENDKNIGQFLQIINQKVNLLANIIVENQQADEQDTVTRINISEGGIATPYPLSFEEDSLVAAKVTLLPDGLGLLLPCRIKACQKTDSDPLYQLNLGFENLDQSVQQIVSRFLAKEQRRQLAKKT